jgi:hypothetical protein
VADFVNTTGDPVFDDTLRQGMTVQLEQSPSLSVVSEESVRQALGLMGKPLGAHLTGQTARQVCERGSSAVLQGSIKPLGSQYVLDLRSTYCRTGENIDDEQVQVARKEDALDAVTRMARGFRVRAGESAAALRMHNTPLAEATTLSLDALKAYSLGWKVAVSQGPEPAIPLIKRAVEIDPSFALAYASLGLMYGSSGSSHWPRKTLPVHTSCATGSAKRNGSSSPATTLDEPLETRKRPNRSAMSGRGLIRASFFPMPFLPALSTSCSPITRVASKRRKRSPSSTPMRVLDIIFSATTRSAWQLFVLTLPT